MLIARKVYSGGRWVAPSSGGSVGLGHIVTEQGKTIGTEAGAFLSAGGTTTETPIGAAPLSALPWLSCAHIGGAKDYYTAAPGALGFAGSRGTPFDGLVCFPTHDTWAQIEAPSGTGHLPIYLAARRPERLIMALALLPRSQKPNGLDAGGQAWKDAANNTGNGPAIRASWLKQIADMKAHLPRDTIFRCCWELNGAVYGSTIIKLKQSEAHYFVTACQWYIDKLLNAMPDARVVFNPLQDGGHNGLDIRDFYFGNSFCHGVGPDLYDRNPPTLDQASWDAKANRTSTGGAPFGINRWLAWAISLNKPLVVPEWSTWCDTTTNDRKDVGQDNPFYIEKMHEFFALNAAHIMLEAVFNSGKAVANGKGSNVLWPRAASPAPKSSDRYMQLFHP